ncbi:hypothetical protein A2316_00310 [Candidatus Falkowbacteria bacterium RIFOXYB2_FULL_38_15]|uniref:Uncharacterized protein n=1 Tax=Candidatus Falkowbacteria bacterium RIFOXYA2_FULL_38_12 TaxID=1797993 RepID=A0A1F5S2Q1_9BACT|nr:MAG: hypothetical protein A2257_04265 [Candidatus Falkowbacteria bacterium RIFOXYA2_FULL_38_12]OGF32840.1 MAG: hypothetical protein A2316_00310 [Candidatus Falkowbacteria bacterium RIFOXYB2_FULL_38_15]OGF42296.1 MAG: hypothetical protein A2555_02200 [Candidatus Falkowbacteria bacterium RIFOXYD2_FULL_39_16]
MVNEFPSEERRELIQKEKILDFARYLAFASESWATLDSDDLEDKQKQREVEENILREIPFLKYIIQHNGTYFRQKIKEKSPIGMMMGRWTPNQEHVEKAKKAEEETRKEIIEHYSEIFLGQNVDSIIALKERFETGAIKMIDLGIFEDEDEKVQVATDMENSIKRDVIRQTLERVWSKIKTMDKDNCHELGLKWEGEGGLEEVWERYDFINTKKEEKFEEDYNKELLEIEKILDTLHESLQKIKEAIAVYCTDCPVCEKKFDVTNYPPTRDNPNSHTEYKCTNKFGHTDSIDNEKVKYLREAEDERDLIISELVTQEGEIIAQLMLTVKDKTEARRIQDHVLKGQIRLLTGKEIEGKPWQGRPIEEIKLVDSSAQTREGDVKKDKNREVPEKNREFVREINFLIFIANNISALKDNLKKTEFENFTNNLDGKDSKKINKKIDNFKGLVESSITDIIKENEDAQSYINEGMATLENVREGIMKILSSKFNEENNEINWNDIIEKVLEKF